MRFSLITATYNSGKTVERCLRSVKAQSHGDIEHLIVDGGSIDNTIEIVEKHILGASLKLICSEPDGGVYEAWNKALNEASGDWILFLGSDDWMANEKSLEMAAEAICRNPKAERCNFVFGNTLGVDGRRLGLTPNKWAWRKSEHWWNRWRGSLPLPAHPGILHSARVFRDNNRFDESYRICADTKLLWETNFINSHCWIDVDLVTHVAGGLSQSRKTIRLHREERSRMLAEIGLGQPAFAKSILIVKDYAKELSRGWN